MDVIASEGGLVIRRMRDEPDEYERMAAWQNEPHVREWWDPDEPPLSPDEARRRYRALTRADSPMTASVFLESQADQNREHYETDDSSLFFRENEHQRRF